MKRATNLSTLLDCSTPWLAWWQELILNWVASWESVETLHVTSSRTNQEATWEVLSDLELARMELEETLGLESGQRGG